MSMKSKYCPVFLLLVLTMVSCQQKEWETPAPRVSQELVFTAGLADASETRTHFQREGDVLKTVWDANESISIFYGGASTNGGSKFTSTNDQPTEEASFSGVLDAFTGMNEGGQSLSFWSIYPYASDNAYDGDETVTLTLPTVQTAVEENISMNTYPMVAKTSGLSLSFYNVGTLLRVCVSSPDITGIVFRGNNGEVVSGRVSVTMDSDGRPVWSRIAGQGKTYVTLKAPEGDTFEVGKYYYIAFLPQTFSNGWSLSFQKAGSAENPGSFGFYKKTDSAVFERAKSKNASNRDQGINFSSYVDMGNGLKIATVNIGGDSPTDKGDKFAWGETTTKSNYSWINYLWGTQDAITKYTLADGRTVLEPQDDAATVICGEDWRTPTEQEMRTLFNQNLYDIVYGDGYITITSKDPPHEHITLYASNIAPNYMVDYWTSTYMDSSYNPNCNAWAVRINSSSQTYSFYGGLRIYGYPIRPVFSRVFVSGVSLNKSTLELIAGRCETLVATITPSDASKPGIQWTSSDDAVATVDENGTVTAIAAGTATITATALDGGSTATCAVTVKPEWVEMGPGHEWAICNVGAELPTDAGDRFAWGETTPKESYSWVNYRWLTPNYITKYQAEDNNYQALWYTGYAGAFNGDGITILEPEDDAATENWNSEWQMPTRSEWQWLYDHSEMVATTENCVPGVRVTSTVPGYTQNSIFLPYGTQGLNCANGGYWSSSLRVEKTETAHKMSIANGADGWTTLWFDTREKGYMVRPVRVPSVRVTGVTLDQSSIFFPWIRKTQTLTATVTPANAAMPDVVWNSSDPDVATVSLDGVVTAVSFGEATITATTVDGEMTASCEVTVQCWSGVQGGHKYVDMGGGLKWAVCNLNNSGWDDDNVHFLWMETDPWARGSFYEHTELWDNTTGDFVSYIGGEPWRRPELADYKWLMNNCDWEFTTENGMNGVLVTSQETQRCLFLPMAGYFDSGDSFRTDEGYYWAAVPGQCLIIRRNSRITMGGKDDSQGMLVRPVFGWLPESEYQ